MGEKISGGCACGAIRYETDADPVAMLNCHCRDCQRSTGSAYAAVMVMPGTEVRLQGEPRYFKTVGNAGHAVERGFCANCGSPVTVKLERMPQVLGLHAAGLDAPSRYRPAMDIFTESAHAWDVMNAETEKRPRGLLD
jgi:hypothetical protein